MIVAERRIPLKSPTKNVQVVGDLVYVKGHPDQMRIAIIKSPFMWLESGEEVIKVNQEDIIQEEIKNKSRKMKRMRARRNKIVAEKV